MLIFVGKMNVPNYTALSTDVVANAIPGASIIGAIVLLTDTAIWKIILPDLTLADYALPISFNGSVDIGAVHIDQQISESVEVAPYYDTKSVAVPGTSESLTSTDVYVVSLIVYPKTTNLGNVFFGNSSVDRLTSKQMIIGATNTSVGVDVPLGNKFNLKNWYLDADSAGDGLQFTYLK
jgi:hypothetical protein